MSCSRKSNSWYSRFPLWLDHEQRVIHLSVINHNKTTIEGKRTEVFLYIASGKSTSYDHIIDQSALWLMLLKAFLKSISILKKRYWSLFVPE